jgi:alpha-1,6-mannosyltransferase
MSPPAASPGSARQAPGRVIEQVAIITLGWVLLAVFAIRVGVLSAVAEDVRAFQAAYLLGFAGYALLTWTVWRRPASALGDWRWWLLGCVLLRLAVLTVEPSDDAYRYVWEGKVQRAGYNPFVFAPDHPRLAELRDEEWHHINHPDYSAIYPPLAQVEFLAVALIRPSIYAVKIVHVLWDCLVVVLLAGCLKRSGRSPHVAITYGLCPLVLSAIGIEGHVDSLMLLFLILAVGAVQSERVLLAGALCGLAIASKILAVVLLPWFLWRHWRAALVAIGVVAACYLPYASAGAALFDSLFRFPVSEPFFSMPAAFGITDYQSRVARILAVMILGGIVAVLAMRRSDFVLYALGAFSALLVLMPIVHAWYFTWVILFVAFHIRLHWLAASAAMVVYYQAEFMRSTTGVWTMPAWASRAVWGVWLAVFLIELMVVLGRRRRAEARRETPL